MFDDFWLLNIVINPHYHSCVFKTDIYLTVSLSTHGGDDTPQKHDEFLPAARDASANAVPLYTLLPLINVFRGSTAFGTIDGSSNYTRFFYSIKQIFYGTVRLPLRKKEHIHHES